MPVSINKEEKKTKSGNETLKKYISQVDERKLTEPRIAGRIPLWQIWEKIPFFILSAILVFITLYNPTKQDTSLKAFSLLSRLANAPVAFVTYLEKTFWPHDMAIFYPFSDQLPVWQVLGATLLILVISAAVIAAAKRLPSLFVGWLWFAITILPVIGIFQISLAAPYAMADRYYYLPSIGIAVILAWGIPFLIKREDTRRKILLPVSIAALSLMTVFTWQQCGYWKNSSELWSHSLHVTTDNALAHDQFANALFTEGKTDQAFVHFNEAIHLEPAYTRAYNDRGVAYAKLSRYQQAMEDFNEAIRLRPNYADAYNNRATAYLNMGQYQLAIRDYNKAITVNPDHPDAYKNRELVYSKLGLQRTVEDYNADAYHDRGVAYAKLGQDQRAVEDYTKAISLKRDYVDAYNDRGVAYAKLGQYQRAIEDYTKAIRLKQDYADAYNNRGITYFKQGSKKLCCDDLLKACKLGNCKTLQAARNSGDCP
jgi:tetratricopeptide (TPR) repeat protein